MPVGRPDWYNDGKSNIISTMQDGAELAVRLGSPVNFDRTGKTIFYDTFSRLDDLYDDNSIGLTSGPSIVTDRFITGNGSVYAIVGVGANNYLALTRYLPLWDSKYMQCEIAVNCDIVPKTIQWGLGLIKDGIQSGCFGTLTDYGTKLTVTGSTGAPITVATFSSTIFYEKMFNNLAASFDFEEGIGFQLKANELTFDVSHITMWKTALSVPNHIRVIIGAYSDLTNPLQIWVDRYIVSEDL